MSFFIYNKNLSNYNVLSNYSRITFALCKLLCIVVLVTYFPVNMCYCNTCKYFILYLSYVLLLMGSADVESVTSCKPKKQKNNKISEKLSKKNKKRFKNTKKKKKFTSKYLWTFSRPTIVPYHLAIQISCSREPTFFFKHLLIILFEILC
jgi:hypothetical protein